jgi:hypothetical protein
MATAAAEPSFQELDNIVGNFLLKYEDILVS